MTSDELRAYFSAHPDDAFRPDRCKTAGLTAHEARFLVALLDDQKDNRWVIQFYGMGRAWILLKRGLADNPLGILKMAHTNIWRVTDRGLAILGSLAGQGG